MPENDNYFGFKPLSSYYQYAPRQDYVDVDFSDPNATLTPTSWDDKSIHQLWMMVKYDHDERTMATSIA